MSRVAATGLPGTSHDRLLDDLHRIGPGRGVARARRSIEFANASAASVGESLSRAQIHLLGFPEPELQVRLARADGGHDIVDFDWPEHGIVGEFDGKQKYFREELSGGRTSEEILWAERERERRIKRSHRRDMARWVWGDALSGAGIRAELLATGLPIVRRTPLH